MITFARRIPPIAAACMLGLAATLPGTPSVAADAASLTIQISGARNDDGQIALLLFRDSTGYPDDPKKAFRSALAPLKHRSANLVMRDLPPGRYVVTLIHDENKNGKLDTNFIGVPTEGYGFSNNPKVGLSAPKFDACAFVLNPGRATTIHVGVQY